MLAIADHKGFTLVELSVVLVIIGILVGLGSAMIGPMTTFVKVRETRDMQDATLQSIAGSAASGNTIPNTDRFASVAKSTLDAWGQKFVYLYDGNLYSGTPGKDTICGRRTAALTIATTDPAATVSNVAFAVFSKADNVAFKSSLNGVAISASGAASGTVTVTGPNSDLVRWMTLDELRSRVGCQGAPLKIVSNELPVASKASGYSVTVYADGGVPFAANPSTYKWCVNTLPAGFNTPPTGGVAKANCLTATETDWGAASQGVNISFAADAVTSGSYLITVFARDYSDGTSNSNECGNAAPGDNCAQKTFVLTVNP